MEKITSVKNQTVKNWKKLHSAKGRKESGCYLIEGEHLYLEALSSGAKIKEIILTEKYSQTQPNWPNNANLVSDEVMNVLTQTETAPGIICVVEVSQQALPKQWEGKYVLLDGVQDPGNAGTIVRTADAAGFAGVVFGTGSVDPYNDKVVRSMQGSHFHIPIYRTDLLPVLATLKEQQVPVYGTALDAEAKRYFEVEKAETVAVVLGNEGNGISQAVLAQTTCNVYIPIYGKAESLNVAVAAGIVLYHFAS